MTADHLLDLMAAARLLEAALTDTRREIGIAHQLHDTRMMGALLVEEEVYLKRLQLWRQQIGDIQRDETDAALRTAATRTSV